MAKARKKKTAAVEYPWIAEDLRRLAVPIGDLVLDPTNARRHDEKNIQAIAASLKHHGQVSPLVANRGNNQVVIGKGRLEAARRLGWSHLAVVWRELTDAEQQALSVSDNRTAELATWDESLLDEILIEIRSEQSELFADLLLHDLEPLRTGETVLKPVDARPPPAMSWVLVGIPTVRFGEIATAIEGLADVEGIILETTSNDG